MGLILNNNSAYCAESEKALTDKDFLQLIKESPSKAQYPNNSAICLFYDETDRMNENGSGVYTIHVMIKILDDSGGRLGEISLT